MNKATNSVLMRRKNEKMILSLIYRSPISRVEIAKETGLTKAAVTIITDDLKKRGIIKEEKGSSSCVGRTPLLLTVCGSSAYMIGVNIRRVGISVGITDLCGSCICEQSIPICPPDEAIAKIAVIIKKQIAQAAIENGQIYKISVVAPGPADKENGIIMNPPNFNEWHGFHIVEELEKVLEYDVVFENVSLATALAEKYFGAAKGVGNFMALQVDEGVGSGIVVNDELLRFPCEIGHISVKHDGTLCECGNRGCLEKYAAVPNILQGSGYKSWRECVDDGNMDIINAQAEYLSTAIVTANNIFGLDMAVLCGDIAYRSEKLSGAVLDKTLCKMLLKKEFGICTGTVRSRTLIAVSSAIHDFLSE